jgi:hypothetical protein
MALSSARFGEMIVQVEPARMAGTMRTDLATEVGSKNVGILEVEEGEGKEEGEGLVWARREVIVEGRRLPSKATTLGEEEVWRELRSGRSFEDT